MAQSEWAAMQDEFLHRRANVEAGLDFMPYHPVERRAVIGSRVTVAAPVVLMRLKGSTAGLRALDRRLEEGGP